MYDRAVRLESIFPGESELARRMRELDWNATPLGPPSTWPANLRTAVGICLESRFPLHVWWGPSLTLFYNDAYVSFLGRVKHPAVLGRSGSEAWAEIWDQIGPMIERVFSTATASWSEDILMFFDRALPKEEVYVTFSFSPVLGDDERVEGMFCACTETTGKIIGNRRLETLRKLGIRAAEGVSVDAACTHCAEVLAENPHDVPFAAIYILDVDRGRAVRKAMSGSVGDGLLPTVISLSDEDCPWAVAAALRNHRAESVDLAALGVEVPGGPWPESARAAVVAPIPSTSPDRPVGALVTGVSPRRVLDDSYRSFFGLVAGHVGTAIADAEAYEAERKRAEALAEIDRAKSVFFGNVSHEFRTPLTLMLGPLADCLAHGDLPPERRDQLAVVHRNALRLTKLVNTLLEFARFEAGRISATYESVDLAQATAELASLFRSAVERAGLRFEVDCPPLPDAAFVDREMWEKIVLNLLSNALKFTFTGEIAVALRAERGRAVLTVRDTGTGIPPEELPRIFERFHRVLGSRARSHEGSGIGLAMVHELVKLHGGEVHAESVPQRGTTFTVSIPLGSARLVKEPVAARQVSVSDRAAPFVEEALRWVPGDPRLRRPSTASASVQAPVAVGERVGRARVLLADDNSDLREYVSSILERAFEVEAVANGEEALEACRRRAPDLVLADVMMPAIDGFALLRLLRSDPVLKMVPVIFLSARAGEESKVEGLERGADDYLVKPFSARELLARVHAHLELAELRMQVARERRAREEARKVMVAELQHRARNLLAVVESIAGETLRSSKSLVEAQGKLEQRLAALGRVHRLLAREDSRRVTVRKLVSMELRAIAPDAKERIEISGPTVTLPVEAVQTLALALHELATNAVKYGALRVRRGDLAVRWEVRGANGAPRTLRLSWNETGIPRRATQRAIGRGFGRELIERALPYELDARTQLEIGRGEVRCTVELPLQRPVALPGVGQMASAEASP
jgi:signal transduction histidine kinase